ncbi:MAG: hypothetical protein AAF399_21935, partial [Bacteroidota bacterium]
GSLFLGLEDQGAAEACPFHRKAGRFPMGGKTGWRRKGSVHSTPTATETPMPDGIRRYILL